MKIKKTAIIFVVLFAKLTYSQIPNKISKEEKVFGLSKFWQEVNYNFVYLSKIDKKEWNSMYLKLIREVQETENDYEYYRLLQKFSAFLKDGHTNIWFPKEIQDEVLNSSFKNYKLILSNIEGKAIITRINTSKKEELPIGTEIVKVNGIPTQEYIEKNVKPYISSSTKHILEDWSIKYLLEGYVGSVFKLEVKTPKGKLKKIQLIHEENMEKELYPPLEKIELAELKWVGKDILYLALNSFSDWKIMDLLSKKLPEIYKAKKIIIDLRKNGGGEGNIAREIIKYLTKDKVIYGAKTQTRLHMPAFKAWGKWVKAKDTTGNAWAKKAYLSKEDLYYHHFPFKPYSTANLDIVRMEIPTAILIGHNTASAAEDFLIYADNQEHMVKIGEPTFGSTGQPLVFKLPNGGSARVCTKKDTYSNGKEFVGVGIQPDIKVTKKLSDYIRNQDPVLEKAIEYLNKKQ